MTRAPLENFSIHSNSLGEESTFEYPDPDPEVEMNKNSIDVLSLGSDNGWEDSMDKIHIDSRYSYAKMVGELTYKTRINLYKLLGSLNWAKYYCNYVLEVIKIVGKLRQEKFINTVITFYVTRRPLYLNIVFGLKEPQLEEFLSELSLEMIQKLVELSFYLEKKQFDDFIHLVLNLSFREVLDLMEANNESFAKLCRLCRHKRLYILEYRMQQSQIKPEHGMMPGIVGHYEKAEIWQADGEHFYTFDYDQSLIFWRGKEVDLMKICDDCLHDVNHAICEVNRYEPLQHLEGPAKKDLATSFRREEQARARMIFELGVKRLHRRCKEWAIKALKTQREGYIREASDRKAATDKILLDRAVAQRKEAQLQLISTAMSSDRHWLKQEKATQQERSAKRFENANLQYKHEFSRINPLSVSRTPQREHVYSWKMSGLDKEGLPITKEAASERFGTGAVVPDIRLAELSLWKQQTAYLHKNYLDRVAADERCKAEARTKEANDINRHIEENQFAVNRAAKLRRLAEEQAEEDRLEARVADRVRRRLARIKAMEEAETSMMEAADKYSWQHRYFLKECDIIKRELQNMRNEEKKQRKIDNFWGIPTYIVYNKNKQESENAAWRAKIETLRAIGMETKVWVPYKSEIGNFRDRVTGLPIVPPERVREFEHYKGRGPKTDVDFTGTHTKFL